jgi:cytochrome b561/polyisoprenoid-binding protein YceI
MERQDYTATAKTLHWLIAALIFVMFPLAWTMGDFSGLAKFKLYNLHKSIGLVILALMTLRLLWRALLPTPALPDTVERRERAAAHVVHVALYAALFLMALSGWATISASAKPSAFFNYTAFPLIPGLGGLPAAEKKSVAELFKAVHEVAAYGLLALVALHAAAAFRHAFILRDGIMSRMLPRFAQAPKATKFTLAALAILGGGALSLGGGGDARAAEWGVDPKKSEVGFEASGSGYATKGVFKTYKAEIEFDPDLPEQMAIRVSLDMRSATTDSADVDQTLQSSDFFNPGRYPSAVFVARGATPNGEGRYILNGQLTLKGVTKPVTLPFSIDIQSGVAAVKGETTINRLDFGVGPETVAGMAVDKDVKLTVGLTAMRLDN